MRKKIGIFLITALLLASAVGVTAWAAWEDFPDVRGHWAEDVLHRAYDEGLLKGSDGMMKPDDPIRLNEMAAIVNRLFDTQLTGPISETITPEKWYYADAQKASALGFIDANTTVADLEAYATREEVFILIARAFQYIEAEPDYSCLDGYWDAGQLSKEGRAAAAALVSRKLIEGFSGQLNIGSTMTRAEFVAVIYRIADLQLAEDTLTENPGTTVILPVGTASTRATLQNVQLTEDVVINAQVRDLRLFNVQTAGRILVRSDVLDRLTIQGSTQVDRLVLAHHKGLNQLSVVGAAQIDTLVVGDGESDLRIGGNVSNVEITGNGRTITLYSVQLDSLKISGTGNRVILQAGSTVDQVLVTDTGTNNQVEIHGQAGRITAAGRGLVLSGRGRAETVDQRVGDCTITLSVGEILDNTEPDLSEAGVYLTTSVDPVPVETWFILGAGFTGVPEEGVDVQAAWYRDGVLVQDEGRFTLLPSTVLSYVPEITYSRDMDVTLDIELKVTHLRQDGETETLYAQRTVTLENYSEAYYDELEAKTQAVLDKVTSVYRGNYTLQWALDNDYTTEEKEIWINAKGYTSDTQYLLWISLGTQHVNVFQGQAGEWELIHSYVVGTGKASTPTPVGVYKTTYKQTGWFTDSYDCKPVVRFYAGTGYAFHSRLYYPGTNILSDARIGYPISLGCIRMYDEDIQWLYNNIPTNTTVVVY